MPELKDELTLQISLNLHQAMVLQISLSTFVNCYNDVHFAQLVKTDLAVLLQVLLTV